MKIIDMHCDTISRIYQERKRGKHAALRSNSFHLDLEKMKHAGYLLQNFAMFVDTSQTSSPYGDCREQIQIFQEEMEKNQDFIAPVTSYSEIMENEQQGKMSALITLEEGEVCEGSLEKLKKFYQLGARMMTFTWNFPNKLGFPGEPAANHLSQSQGLTSLGREFLEEMEHLGMIPDVSHLSDAGIRDVCQLARKPFCASHSNARALCQRGRNLPDELIRSIAECGGVIGANYYGPFLSGTSDVFGRYYSYVKDIALHIHHIADVGGIDCIGLGSDFDGIDNNLELKNCGCLELLEQELQKTGFHESEIEKIFFKNVLAFYREVL
ncbi:MAG: membrane dipeptidase [Lachnospiraceae bacterium]|nr:membrane dipeptidase [Lachnospiraceae bacterium]